MNQNLVWTFQCSTHKTPLLLEATEKDKLKWEARFFWPENEPILLNKVDNSLLDFNQYEKKHKEDHYYLVPNTPFNIKRRKDRLLYKPIIEQTLYAIGYGKKIDLEAIDEYPNKTNLSPILLEKMFNKQHEMGIVVTVNKESYTYKFQTTPTIKLELARLEVHNKIYYSACIEGRSRVLVETISEALLGKHKTSDYVSFLNSIVKL